jgi:hypothetical protein
MADQSERDDDKQTGDFDVMLEVNDLIQDVNGEVVLFNDSRLRRVSLASEVPVVAQGTTTQHVTAAGDDVSGFRFLSFANGLTLYFDPDLDVSIREGRQHP